MLCTLSRPSVSIDLRWKALIWLTKTSIWDSYFCACLILSVGENETIYIYEHTHIQTLTERESRGSRTVEKYVIVRERRMRQGEHKRAVERERKSVGWKKELKERERDFSPLRLPQKTNGCGWVAQCWLSERERSREREALRAGKEKNEAVRTTQQIPSPSGLFPVLPCSLRCVTAALILHDDWWVISLILSLWLGLFSCCSHKYNVISYTCDLGPCNVFVSNSVCDDGGCWSH